MKKTGIFILILVIGLVVAGAAYLFWNQSQEQPMVETKKDELLLLSGDGDAGKANDPSLYQQEVAKLKKQLPVEESNFTLTYDYAQDKFYVTLGEPKSEASLAFDAWLASQEISAIPREKFIFD